MTSPVLGAEAVLRRPPQQGAANGPGAGGLAAAVGTAAVDAADGGGGRRRWPPSAKQRGHATHVPSVKDLPEMSIGNELRPFSLYRQLRKVCPHYALFARINYAYLPLVGLQQSFLSHTCVGERVKAACMKPEEAPGSIFIDTTYAGSEYRGVSQLAFVGFEQFEAKLLLFPTFLCSGAFG